MTEPFCFDINNDYYRMREQGCRMCSEANPLLNFFLITSVTGVSCLFAMLFVAIFVYGPHIEKLKNEREEDEEKFEIPFEFKYPIKFAKNTNNLETIENCSVFCSTPDGEVYMKYSKEHEGFNYWSKSKNVKYKYLETVARKFVSVFKCSDLYILRKADDVFFDLPNDRAYKLINDILYGVDIDLAGNYVDDFEVVDVSYMVRSDSEVEEAEEESIEEGEEKEDQDEVETDEDSSTDDSDEESDDDEEEDIEYIMEKLNSVDYTVVKEDDMYVVKVKREETADDDADSDDDLFMKTKNNIKRKVKVPEKISANKYRYNGKVEDVILLKKTTKKEKKLDYKSWKNSWF